MRQYRFLRVLKVALLASFAVGIVSLIVMSLWNALMPSIFALRAISFWQALGLLVLSKLLFGGFRPFGGGGPRWRQRLFERWERMSPEEREKFRQGLRRDCGPHPRAETPRRDAEVQA